MKKAEAVNINTRTHWNGVYGDDKKRDEYEMAGTSSIAMTGDHHMVLDKTHRFTRAVQEVRSGDKVLDIGCGVGNFTRLAKDRFPECEVWGVDISDEVIEANKKKRQDITYLYQHIGDLDQVPADYFDLVFCGETIEHLDHPNMLFQDALRVLKQGGKLIVTTPNEDHIKSEEHVWYFEKSDIIKLYADNGFTDAEFVELPDTEHLFVLFAVGVKK